jgi:hypothetical protein
MCPLTDDFYIYFSHGVFGHSNSLCRFCSQKNNTLKGNVSDKRSRILEVVVVRRIFNLGTGNLERGGSGKALRKGRSVYD